MLKRKPQKSYVGRRVPRLRKLILIIGGSLLTLVLGVLYAVATVIKEVINAEGVA